VVAVTQPNLELSLRLASDALSAMGHAVPGHLLPGGTNSCVFAYPSVQLAVRVTDPASADLSLVGYRVAAYVGEEVAVVPLDVQVVEDHVVAAMPLGTPLDYSPSSWTAAQLLAARVHATPPPPFSLPRHSVTADLDVRLAALEHTEYSHWVEPLTELLERLARRLSSRSREPVVLLHGDVGAGQVVRRATDLLVDFDRTAVGEVEADWGRLWAWHAAGLLEGDCLADTLDTVYEQTAEEPRIGLIELYGEAYCLRNLSFLLHHHPTDIPRIQAYARVLEITSLAG
jgi:hypothetical protein